MSDADSDDEKKQPVPNAWVGYELFCRPCRGSYERYKGPHPPVPYAYMSKYAHIKTWDNYKANIDHLNKTIMSPTGCEFRTMPEQFYVDSQGCASWAMTGNDQVMECWSKLIVADSMAEFLARVHFESVVFEWGCNANSQEPIFVKDEDQLRYVQFYAARYNEAYAQSLALAHQLSKQSYETYTKAWTVAKQPWVDRFDQCVDCPETADPFVVHMCRIKIQQIDDAYRRHCPPFDDAEQWYVDTCQRRVHDMQRILPRIKVKSSKNSDGASDNRGGGPPGGPILDIHQSK